MQEDNAADFGDCRMFSQPLPVLSFRTESEAMFDEPQRVPLQPLRFGFRQHRLRHLSQELRMVLAPGEVFLNGSLLAFFGIAISETRVVLRSDVTKVAHNVHYFVISQ